MSLIRNYIIINKNGVTRWGDMCTASMAKLWNVMNIFVNEEGNSSSQTCMKALYHMSINCIIL